MLRRALTSLLLIPLQLHLLLLQMREVLNVLGTRSDGIMRRYVR